MFSPVTLAIPVKLYPEVKTQHPTVLQPCTKGLGFGVNDMYNSHQGGKLGLAVKDIVFPTKQCQLEILCPGWRKKKVHR